jgi:hypothetical protein
MNCSGFMSWVSSTYSERLRWRKDATDVGLVAQQRDRLAQEEVEVQQSATSTESDVAIQHLGELRGRKGRVTTEPSRVLGVGRAVVSLTQRPADLLLESRKLPVLEFEFTTVAQLGGQRAHEFAAVRFEREGPQVMILAVLRDDIEGRPVKGAGPNVAHPGAKESLAKLVSRFSGEGHGQYLVGRDLVISHSSLDAQSQDVGLSGPGGRSNEVAPGGRHDGLALLGGEPDQQVV